VSKPSEISIDIDRTDEILQFVRGNPNCTKADVIRHMKGKSAVRTTHALLTSLIEVEKKINVNKVNIQTHLLSINEDNKFNKFHKLLSDIEVLIHRMEAGGFPTGVEHNPDSDPIVNKGTSTVILSEDDKQYRKLSIALQGLENSYRQSFFLILQILYNKIYNSFRYYNQKDWAILFRKLNILNVSLALYPWDQKTARENLAVSTKNIEKCLKDYNRYKYVEDKTDLGDKLIQTIENFKTEFLHPTEQKTADPHEKSG
jgi:hypothetical protein